MRLQAREATVCHVSKYSEALVPAVHTTPQTTRGEEYSVFKKKKKKKRYFRYEFCNAAKLAESMAPSGTHTDTRQPACLPPLLLFLFFSPPNILPFPVLILTQPWAQHPGRISGVFELGLAWSETLMYLGGVLMPRQLSSGCCDCLAYSAARHRLLVIGC